MQVEENEVINSELTDKIFELIEQEKEIISEIERYIFQLKNGSFSFISKDN